MVKWPKLRIFLRSGPTNSFSTCKNQNFSLMWGKMLAQLVRNFALPVRNFALPVRNFKNHDNSYLATRFHMVPNNCFG